MRCDYEQTRKAWLLTKTMYSASQDAKVGLKMADKEKTHRTIINTLLVGFSLRNIPKKLSLGSFIYVKSVL